MFPSLVPDKARPLAPRPYPIPTIYLTCIFGSLLPPGKIRSTSVTLAALWLLKKIPECTSGEVSQDVLAPIQGVLVLVQFLDFFVLNAEEGFEREKDGDRGKEKKGMGWWERFWWKFDLCTNMRGTAWNWKVKNVPNAATVGTSK
jgi:hypothetical protein